MNYLVIHRASNLIVSIVTSSAKLISNTKLKVVLAGEQTLNQYYRLKGLADQAKKDGVEVASLTKLSPAFLESLKLNP